VSRFADLRTQVATKGFTSVHIHPVLRPIQPILLQSLPASPLMWYDSTSNEMTPVEAAACRQTFALSSRQIHKMLIQMANPEFVSSLEATLGLTNEIHTAARQMPLALAGIISSYLGDSEFFAGMLQLRRLLFRTLRHRSLDLERGRRGRRSRDTRKRLLL